MESTPAPRRGSSCADREPARNVATTTRARGRKRPLDGYDEFARRVVRDWGVRGAAIAVVHDGDVVFSQGIGERDAEHDLPVTEHTLFPLASVTKAFTTMSLAVLADDGLLDWDTPVREYLPEFRLWDQFATERMTPRDLVTHRSGLPRHDMMWYHSDATREELVRRLRYLEPTTDFRSFWQYQNLMYMTAGYLAGRVAGSSWEDLVRRRIFEALGMASSMFSVTTAQQTPDFSLPYMQKNRAVVRIPFYEEQQALGPAGAIVSNVVDMSRWLLLHLHKGRIGEHRVVSAGQIAQMHTAQIVSSNPSRFPELAAQSYALGWYVQPYRGHHMLYHSGNIDGFSTLCAFLPDDNVGVVALTNMKSNPAPYILSWNVFDRFLGLDTVPWTARYRADWKELERARQQGRARNLRERVRRTRPSHPLRDYAGTYAHPGYGEARVDLEGSRLVVRYNTLELPLRHYHYDIFEMTSEQFDQSMKVQFTTDIRGRIARFTAPLEPTGHDIVFVRQPDDRMKDPSFLKRFAGAYDFMGLTVVVALEGDVLRIAIPGQPEYRLEPLEGTEFACRDVSSVSVRFAEDASGGASEVAIDQPPGLFLARRIGT